MIRHLVALFAILCLLFVFEWPRPADVVAVPPPVVAPVDSRADATVPVVHHFVRGSASYTSTC